MHDFVLKSVLNKPLHFKKNPSYFFSQSLSILSCNLLLNHFVRDFGKWCTLHWGSAKINCYSAIPVLDHWINKAWAELRDNNGSFGQIQTWFWRRNYITLFQCTFMEHFYTEAKPSLWEKSIKFPQFLK